MKTLCALFFSILLFGGCSSSDSSNDSGSGMIELEIGRSVTGSIATEGEVDWYHYQALSANRTFQVKCTNETYRSDLALLVTVFGEDGDGNRVRLYGDHAPELSQRPANIAMYVHVDHPKDFYISVRDLMDDDFSDNPYSLSIDMSDTADGNESFTDAVLLPVGAFICQERTSDSVGYLGDVDTFRFEASGGVYDIGVDFSALNDSNVRLSIDLYDDSGTLIESLNQSQGDVLSSDIRPYYMRPYLTPGTYYLLVYDIGRDDYDTMSPYEVCVKSVSAGEMMVNDETATAQPVTSTVSGSLDYFGDKDVYQFSTGGGLKVVTVDFQVAYIDFDYKISMENANGEVLLSHYQAGGRLPDGDPLVYRAQVFTRTDINRLTVEAAEGQVIFRSNPYAITLNCADIDDYYDENGIGNLENQPVALTHLSSGYCFPEGGHNNYKVAYRGDMDWYSIVAPASPSPQILEVFVTADPSTNVDYYLRVKRSDGNSMLRSVHGETGESVKTSLLVPADSEPATYLMRVADYQGNDGDPAHNYQIRARVVGIIDAGGLPVPPVGVETPVYFSEAVEFALSGGVTVEQSALDMQQVYRVNTQALDFSTATLTADFPEAGLTTLSFPWIGGYVDYQGDIDFFKVDFSALTQTSNWYYEIKMELYAASSVVEPIWEFYRDSNHDGRITARSVSRSCVFASGGDSLADNASPNGIMSTEGEVFWVGNNSGWAGVSDFYLGIRDFNFLNHAPDDDWGYDVPYYFRLTLIYHPGVSQP